MAQIRADELCMRSAASEWADIPGRLRYRLIRCANRAARILDRAGFRR